MHFLRVSQNWYCLATCITQQVTHELALLAASSRRGQGVSGFAGNEAEMDKLCFSLSVWIPFTELLEAPVTAADSSTQKRELVDIGGQHICMCAARAILAFIYSDIMWCSRQMFATWEDGLVLFLPQMSCIILVKILVDFYKIQIDFSYLIWEL